MYTRFLAIYKLPSLNWKYFNIRVIFLWLRYWNGKKWWYRTKSGQLCFSDMQPHLTLNQSAVNEEPFSKHLHADWLWSWRWKTTYIDCLKDIWHIFTLFLTLTGAVRVSLKLLLHVFFIYLLDMKDFKKSAGANARIFGKGK